MTELWKLDACAQAELVRRREVSSVELVRAAIARIEALNPRLNAVITPLFDRAMVDAGGKLPDGPFTGVPLLLKDFLCETAGDPYYEGSRYLRRIRWRSPADSLLAARFRDAGFVMVGRTNVPEFAASATTEPAAFGPTRNPWNPEHSAGGSSGGSAAAVAAGMVSVAHANDGTGSIRIPAACCGLVGLKPSRGRVPVAPTDAGRLENVVEHVVTRSVRDAAAVLDAIRADRAQPGKAFLADAGADPGRLRVGFVRHDPLLRNCREIRPHVRDNDSASETAVLETARLLQSLGHSVEESYPPALDGRTGLGGPRGIIAAAELAARVDGWIGRTGQVPDPGDIEAATWRIVHAGRQSSLYEVEEALARLRAGIPPILEWWGGGFDLLLLPTTNGTPPLIGAFSELDLPEQNWRLAESFGLSTVPWSFTGQPAISLPAIWSNGLPVGIQLVAGVGRDDVLIQVAFQLGAAMSWEARWPPEAQFS